MLKHYKKSASLLMTLLSWRGIWIGKSENEAQIENDGQGGRLWEDETLANPKIWLTKRFAHIRHSFIPLLNLHQFAMFALLNEGIIVGAEEGLGKRSH